MSIVSLQQELEEVRAVMTEDLDKQLAQIQTIEALRRQVTGVLNSEN